MPRMVSRPTGRRRLREGHASEAPARECAARGRDLSGSPGSGGSRTVAEPRVGAGERREPRGGSWTAAGAGERVGRGLRWHGAAVAVALVPRLGHSGRHRARSRAAGDGTVRVGGEAPGLARHRSRRVSARRRHGPGRRRSSRDGTAPVPKDERQATARSRSATKPQGRHGPGLRLGVGRRHGYVGVDAGLVRIRAGSAPPGHAVAAARRRGGNKAAGPGARPAAGRLPPPHGHSEVTPGQRPDASGAGHPAGRGGP